jgi:hypothetical protein
MCCALQASADVCLISVDLLTRRMMTSMATGASPPPSAVSSKPGKVIQSKTNVFAQLHAYEASADEALKLNRAEQRARAVHLRQEAAERQIMQLEDYTASSEGVRRLAARHNRALMQAADAESTRHRIWQAQQQREAKAAERKLQMQAAALAEQQRVAADRKAQALLAGWCCSSKYMLC